VKKYTCIAELFYCDCEKPMRKALAASLLILAATTIAATAAPALDLWGIDTSDRAAAAVELGTVADHRIDGVFAALSGSPLDPAIDAAASAPKGDFAPACSSAVWPDIDAACLATADGRPAPRARMIAIGYQAGENTTVLVRIPSAGTAQR
jgi:hypothetical protein